MKAFFLRPLICLFLLLFFAVSGWSEPLAFRRAMQLALQRGAASTAAAEQERAHASYLEARNAFLPTLVLGSGLAKTFGFPLSIEGSAPSVFQVAYQSYLINPAQREFVRSAKREWEASASGSADQRAANLLEAALTYIQLDTLTSRMRLLNQQQTEADRLVSVVAERMNAGVDTQMDLTRAKLAAAQVRMRQADAEGAAAVLRERLAQLTGLPANSIETVTESIPEIPDSSQQPDIVAAVLASNPAVKQAEQTAQAVELRALGEHRTMLPAVDAVAQYGLFTRYNNYDLYFNRFQRNNATIGVAIRFPLLNFAGRAHAEAADAEAVKARRQAEATKQQVSNDTIKLARSIKQLQAAEQVAQLDYQLSQEQTEAVQARIQAGAPGQAPAPAPGPKDLQLARIQSNDKYSAYLDMTFELQKAELQLLRALHQLEGWATR